MPNRFSQASVLPYEPLPVEGLMKIGMLADENAQKAYDLAEAKLEYLGNIPTYYPGDKETIKNKINEANKQLADVTKTGSITDITNKVNGIYNQFTRDPLVNSIIERTDTGIKMDEWMDKNANKLTDAEKSDWNIIKSRFMNGTLDPKDQELIQKGMRMNTKFDLQKSIESGKKSIGENKFKLYEGNGLTGWGEGYYSLLPEDIKDKNGKVIKSKGSVTGDPRMINLLTSGLPNEAYDQLLRYYAADNNMLTSEVDPKAFQDHLNNWATGFADDISHNIKYSENETPMYAANQRLGWDQYKYANKPVVEPDKAHTGVVYTPSVKVTPSQVDEVSGVNIGDVNNWHMGLNVGNLDIPLIPWFNTVKNVIQNPKSVEANLQKYRVASSNLNVYSMEDQIKIIQSATHSYLEGQSPVITLTNVKPGIVEDIWKTVMSSPEQVVYNIKTHQPIKKASFNIDIENAKLIGFNVKSVYPLGGTGVTATLQLSDKRVIETPLDVAGTEYFRPMQTINELGATPSEGSVATQFTMNVNGVQTNEFLIQNTVQGHKEDKSLEEGNGRYSMQIKPMLSYSTTQDILKTAGYSKYMNSGGAYRNVIKHNAVVFNGLARDLWFNKDGGAQLVMDQVHNYTTDPTMNDYNSFAQLMVGNYINLHKKALIISDTKQLLTGIETETDY